MVDNFRSILIQGIMILINLIITQIHENYLLYSHVAKLHISFADQNQIIIY